MLLHKSNNKEKQQLNQMEQEDNYFKDSFSKSKNRIPYKRQRQDWLKEYISENNEDNEVWPKE